MIRFGLAIPPHDAHIPPTGTEAREPSASHQLATGETDPTGMGLQWAGEGGEPMAK